MTYTPKELADTKVLQKLFDSDDDSHIDLWANIVEFLLTYAKRYWDEDAINLADAELLSCGLVGLMKPALEIARLRGINEGMKEAGEIVGRVFRG